MVGPSSTSFPTTTATSSSPTRAFSTEDVTAIFERAIEVETLHYRGAHATSKATSGFRRHTAGTARVISTRRAGGAGALQTETGRRTCPGHRIGAGGRAGNGLRRGEDRAAYLAACLQPPGADGGSDVVHPVLTSRLLSLVAQIEQNRDMTTRKSRPGSVSAGARWSGRAQPVNVRSSAPDAKLDALDRESDALLARMQTAKVRRAMKTALSASGDQLGKAAVAVLRTRRK